MGSTGTGVALLEFTDRRMLATQLQRLERKLECVFVPGDTAVGRHMEEELAAYFAGKLRAFSTPLEPAGTEFQHAVWRVLKSIPYAETRSYGQQAMALGRPSAVRAVARANGDNPVCIVVPCHRVIGANGTLTGYGGGLWRKKWLLHHEITHR
jgi:AraC family transcriptional regulator, regulatory protein of adaptative response / methylated-DNA-[protein]-cysteine methyltransferase